MLDVKASFKKEPKGLRANEINDHIAKFISVKIINYNYMIIYAIRSTPPLPQPSHIAEMHCNHNFFL